MMRYLLFALLVLSAIACGDDGASPVYELTMEGASMQPTIANGARMEVFAYQEPVGMGDIVAFRAPTSLNRDFVKRVIAGPGQQLSINPAEGVAVDGVTLHEPYTQGHTSCGAACHFDIPQFVGLTVSIPAPGVEPKAYDSQTDANYCTNGCYFVMGDNRQNSSDSRQGWLVPVENIIGYVEPPE